MNPKAPQNKFPARLIIFDGICNFCAGSVNFIIRRDPNAKFNFTTIQSDIGIELLRDLGVDPSNPSTFVLIKHGEVFLKSNAALEIARELPGTWSLLYCLRFIPEGVRDLFYGLVARNRYKLFGKRDTCMVPTPDLAARFID